MSKDDRKKYVCINPCWHGGTRWKKGDLALFADDEVPRSNKGEIRHFERVGAGGVVSRQPDPTKPVVTVNDQVKKTG